MGYTQRIRLNSSFYNISGTISDKIQRLDERTITTTEDLSGYFNVNASTVVSVDVDHLDLEKYLTGTYDDIYNFTLPRYQIAKYGGRLQLAYEDRWGGTKRDKLKGSGNDDELGIEIKLLRERT